MQIGDQVSALIKTCQCTGGHTINITGTVIEILNVNNVEWVKLNTNIGIVTTQIQNITAGEQ